MFAWTQDLFSALIKGPNRTPYEDGLFLFDIQLPNIYPALPPLFRYLSQCSGRLNPNLYNNGKVCVSLLGTWIGKVSKRPLRVSRWNMFRTVWGEMRFILFNADEILSCTLHHFIPGFMNRALRDGPASPAYCKSSSPYKVRTSSIHPSVTTYPVSGP